MKMDKGAILASMAVIAVASVLVGAGTMAYFSETEKVGITFAAGTPNLRLSIDYGASWGDSLTYSFPVWAPGDTCSIQVWTKNIGDIGFFNLFVTGDNLGGPNPNLADWIHITDVAYTDTIGWVHPGGGTYYADNNIFGGSDGKLSLRELAMGLTNGKKMNFCWGDPDDKIDYLPANGAMIQKFYIEFTFDPDAGNEWQGKSCSFDLLFRGTDEPGSYVWWPGM